MTDLLPRMTPEPPPGYVAFVERHLAALRDEAAEVVGDEYRADQLYPEVLTDVAARWAWLELLRTWLRRRDVTDRYLRRAFARQSQRWRSEQLRFEASGSASVEFAREWQVEFEVWADDEDAWQGGRWRSPDPGLGVFTLRRPQAGSPLQRSSAALRMAPHLVPGTQVQVGPVAEAAVAWWHAYEARRHRRMVAALAAGLAVAAILTGLAQDVDMAMAAAAAWAGRARHGQAWPGVGRPSAAWQARPGVGRCREMRS